MSEYKDILDAPSETETVQYAGFWLRVAAILIDGILLNIVASFIVFVFLGNDMSSALGTPGAAETIGPMAGFAYLLVFLIQWLYFAFMESSERQATIGKLALGIKVTDLHGERISFLTATGRYFSKILSAIIFFIGFLMAAFTEKKQALHDMIASTLVVRK